MEFSPDPSDEGPVEMEYTTQDGAITLTVRFNDERNTYAPETVEEICQCLEQTAQSLRFGMQHPEVEFKLTGKPS